MTRGRPPWFLVRPALHNRRATLTGAVELISVGWQGEAVIEASDSPDLSADGRFVVFGSQADNLIPSGPAGDPDHHEDHEIFLRDRLLGTTKQISLTPDGKQADEGSITAAITPEAGPDITVFTAERAIRVEDMVPPLPCITKMSRSKPLALSSVRRRDR